MTGSDPLRLSFGHRGTPRDREDLDRALLGHREPRVIGSDPSTELCWEIPDVVCDKVVSEDGIPVPYFPKTMLSAVHVHIQLVEPNHIPERVAVAPLRAFARPVAFAGTRGRSETVTPLKASSRIQRSWASS